MPKPRSDSTLDSLTQVQKDRLREWLVDENLSYEAAKDRLFQDFNVRTSVGALSRFYATRCFSVRASEAKEFAEHVLSEVKETGEHLDEATMTLIKQRAFERAYAREGPVDELATLAKIIADSEKLRLKRQELDISKQSLELKVKQYEDKIQAARASLEKAKNKGGLAKDTIELIEEQLKLL